MKVKGERRRRSRWTENPLLDKNRLLLLIGGQRIRYHGKNTGFESWQTGLTDRVSVKFPKPSKFEK